MVAPQMPMPLPLQTALFSSLLPVVRILEWPRFL
jgi:hypothetical protein